MRQRLFVQDTAQQTKGSQVRKWSRETIVAQVKVLQSVEPREAVHHRASESIRSQTQAAQTLGAIPLLGLLKGQKGVSGRGQAIIAVAPEGGGGGGCWAQGEW